MRTPYILLLAAGAFLGSSVWLAYLAVFAHFFDANTGSAVAAAGFLAATSGWLFSSGMSLRFQLRAKAFEYLQASVEQIILPNHSATLALHWRAVGMDEMLLDEERLVRFWVEEYPHHDLFKELRVIANHYEQMAIAIRCHAVEERMLRIYFATTFRWFYVARLRPLLRFYRNDPPVPNHPNGNMRQNDVFCECDWLAERWLDRDMEIRR